MDQSSMLPERDRHRLRYLYVLAFRSGHAYVGQTVDPRRRRAQHRKAWRQPFAMTVVGRIRGTYADAEDHEQAWRYLAQQHGFAIYADPRGTVVNPSRRMTPARFGLAKSLRWRAPNLPPTSRAVWVGRGIGALGLAGLIAALVWAGPQRIFQEIFQALTWLFRHWQHWLHG